MLSQPPLPLIRFSTALGAILALQSACSSTVDADDLGSTGGAANPGSGGAAAPSGGAAPGGGVGGAAVGIGGSVASGGAQTGAGGADPSSGGASSGGAQATGGAGGGAGGDQGTGGMPASTCVPKETAKAHNPLVTQIFTADPNAIVYGDKIYMYTSHDEDGQEGFDMVDYHVYSTDDLVNWQDHGVIIHANQLPWATRLYAPGACAKNGKYYMYIPNSGSAIGVAVSDDPGGPFTDARNGQPLITPQFPNADVPWLFDPACFIDDDGQAYLYFGGGPSGQNARAVRLNDDMISLKDTSATTIPTTAFFEASFMHKHEGKYYFSYSSDFSAGHGAALEYLMSDSPMSGFQYKGVLLANGSINRGNNNHGSIIEYKGKHYLFYHNRKLEQELGVDKVNNRSVAVQELTYNEDGTIKPLTMSTEDYTVSQLKCLDGYQEVQAERIAEEKGIEVEGKAGETVYIGQISNNDWVAYSQVDFREGATKIVLKVASANGGGKINVVVDGCIRGAQGTQVGSCDVTATGGNNEYKELSCPIMETSGGHDLCLRFSDNPSFRIDSWHLE